jgi:hypothetical protein
LSAEIRNSDPTKLPEIEIYVAIEFDAESKFDAKCAVSLVFYVARIAKVNDCGSLPSNGAVVAFAAGFPDFVWTADSNLTANGGIAICTTLPTAVATASRNEVSAKSENEPAPM